MLLHPPQLCHATGQSDGKCIIIAHMVYRPKSLNVLEKQREDRGKESNEDLKDYSAEFHPFLEIRVLIDFNTRV